MIKLLQIDCSETADIIGLGAGTIKWPSKLIGKTAGGIRYRAAAEPNGAIVRFKANGADCVLRLKKKNPLDHGSICAQISAKIQTKVPDEQHGQRTSDDLAIPPASARSALVPSEIF